MSPRWPSWLVFSRQIEVHLSRDRQTRTLTVDPADPAEVPDPPEEATA
jgi:hypothetical protein